MEDIFELIVTLLVVLVPLLIRRKNKKKEKPGQQKAEKPAQKKPAKPARPEKKSVFEQAFSDDEESLEEIIEQVDMKIDKWIADMDAKTKTKKAQNTGMEPQRLQAEKLVAEPLIPQLMINTPLEEIGMDEGESHTDDAGCIGGSLAHEAGEFHQGMDFHPSGTHERRKAQQDAPIAVQRVKPAVSAAELRRAVLWKEILDQPVSMRE